MPCICNPLSRAEFSGLGPRLWGRPMHGALISGPRATSNCESRQGRKAATVSKFWRAPRESCFEPPTAVPPGSAFVKARVRDHFRLIQSKPLSQIGKAAFLFCATRIHSNLQNHRSIIIGIKTLLFFTTFILFVANKLEFAPLLAVISRRDQTRAQKS